MKLLEKPVKISYTNPLKEWFEDNTIKTTSMVNDYENGMFISINNKGCYYNDLVKEFKDLYQSLIVALTGHKVRMTDIKQLQGEFKGKRISIPNRQTLLDIINKKTPILICGVHNYEKDDFRSRGNEYCHTHFYVYNTHYYLPSSPKDLRDKEDKIERHLSRYIHQKTHKRFQGIIDIRPVEDNVSPIKLYDYLQSPITNPHKKNKINYMANNKHLPSIQYPLTTIYSTKKL